MRLKLANPELHDIRCGLTARDLSTTDHQVGHTDLTIVGLIPGRSTCSWACYDQSITQAVSCDEFAGRDTKLKDATPAYC